MGREGGKRGQREREREREMKMKTNIENEMATKPISPAPSSFLPR